MNRLIKFAVLSLAAMAATAQAQPEADTRVATLVMVKTPPGISRAQIEAGFKAAVPTYQKVPGLVRKYFTVNGEVFGGMYLWKNRAAAEAWYSAAWAAKCKATYGSDCQVLWFDTPVQIDGMASRK